MKVNIAMIILCGSRYDRILNGFDTIIIVMKGLDLMPLVLDDVVVFSRRWMMNDLDLLSETRESGRNLLLPRTCVDRGMQTSP